MPMLRITAYFNTFSCQFEDLGGRRVTHVWTQHELWLFEEISTTADRNCAGLLEQEHSSQGNWNGGPAPLFSTRLALLSCNQCLALRWRKWKQKDVCKYAFHRNQVASKVQHSLDSPPPIAGAVEDCTTKQQLALFTWLAGLKAFSDHHDYQIHHNH